MLAGEFRHTLDAKNRVFIPVKHREVLGETFVVARDIREKCLKIYSLEGWERYIAPIREQNRALAEKVLRFLHRNAAQVTPDAQGRIILPPDLVSYAEITKDVVIVGCNDYAELWSAEKYSAMVEEEDPEEIRADLEQFGL